jgi:hypothetical protein
MKTRSMKGGRFEQEGELLEFNPGQLLARAYRAHGVGASVEVETRTLLSEVNDPMWTGFDSPEAPSPRTRPVHLRDLLLQVPTTEAAVPFIRELLPVVTQYGAGTVVEATPAAEAMMQFAGATNTVRKIAAWVPITDEVAMDGLGLSAYVNSRLVELLYVRDDAQILNGTGTSSELTGILTNPNIQTSTAGANKRQAVVLGISDVEQAETVVDTVVINPVDAWNMFNADDLWAHQILEAGIRIVRTMAIAQGTALVGCFRQAAVLRVRKEATLRVATQADDDFVMGKLKVMAELREALNITAPDLFCAVTLPSTA